jgi:UDP-glucuronate decarboxylase
MMDSDFIGPVNLGNPLELSMKNLASKVIKLTSSSSSIIYKKLPEDDPKRRRPDITLAKSILNWKPTIELDNGLLKTINYFNSN